ncbi:MAG: hypothetical protein A2V70_19560 [Planctomycetes bacterium RBG_13_63_9]|nr:MAG: hypothetical protein A2V70_19560 [Planctomycetes bacterium RBG_13_63_9]
MCFLPVCMGLAYLRFLRQLSASQAAPESWAIQWQRLLNEQGIRRTIPLKVTERLGPALCWTPQGHRVFVPRRVWQELTPRQREGILRHELAHLQRGDLWTMLLARLLVLPHWFNPFAWWALRRQAECAEWACDQVAGGVFQMAVPPGRGHLLIHGPTTDYIQQVIGSRTLHNGQPGGRRNYVHGLVPLDVKLGTGVHEVTVSLRRGATVKGRLVGPQDQPVSDVLMLTTLAMSPVDLEWRGSSITARGGQFELHGCDPRQTYHVAFLDPKNQWGTALEIPGRQPAGEPLTVHLAPCGTAEVRFVDPDGRPLANEDTDSLPSLSIVITPGPSYFQSNTARKQGLLSADEDFVANFDRQHYWGSRKTDQDGRCTLPALIPGAKYRLSGQDFTVKPGETHPLPDIVVKRR